MPTITYYLYLKENNDVENLTDKAKKLHKKLLAAKGKDKAPTEDDLDLPTIESIISGTRRSLFSYHSQDDELDYDAKKSLNPY